MLANAQFYNMGWPAAVAALGIALATASCVWAFFWSLSKSGLDEDDDEKV